MDESITTRTENVTRHNSGTVHVGMEDTYPDGAARGWPLRASYTLCERGKVRKTHRYLPKANGAVTCAGCLRALETTEASGVSHE
jgi:hypothetical protein